MLGPLLRIGQQFLGQPLVFVLGAAAAARAGQRADRHLAVHDADHDLRRAADQRALRRPQEEHERARVHHPQRAIDLERIDRQRHRQPLADHHLKDVAGADVLDALAHRVFELGLGEVRFVRRAVASPPVSMSTGASDRRRRRELFDQPIDAAAGVVVALAVIALAPARLRSSRAFASATTIAVFCMLSNTIMWS